MLAASAALPAGMTGIASDPDVQPEPVFSRPRNFSECYAVTDIVNQSRAVHVMIAGRVQGVWFRGSTQIEARGLGVTGWVRNLSDGRVEAWAEGYSTRIESFLAFCRQGPSSALVTGIEFSEEKPQGDFKDFTVRRTN